MFVDASACYYLIHNRCMMFKKPKRGFRSRKAQGDSDEEKPTETIPDPLEEYGPKPPSTIVPGLDLISQDGETKKKKKKSKKDKDSKTDSMPRNNSVLSFHDDEEEETQVFKVKKSSHSRRIAKQLRRETKKEKEKQAEEESVSVRPAVDSVRVDLSVSPHPKFKGSVNPPLSSNGNDSKSAAGVKIQIGGEDSSESSDDGGDPRNKKMGSHTFRSLIKSGEIPDAHLIHQARKRRQMAREQSDFIVLEEEEEMNDKNSRLIREEDHDLSGDEDERINFTVASRERELRRIQNTILAAQEDSHSGGSDQEREWEEQQIRKGVSIPQVLPEPVSQANGQLFSNYQQYMYSQSSNIFNPQAPSVNLLSGAPASSPMPQVPKGAPIGVDLPQITIESVKKRLRERLDEMRSVHRTHCLERDDIKSRYESSEVAIEDCKEAKPRLEEHSRFFQEMRGYVRDLVECLNEKVPQIEYMERLMNQLLKQRAEKLVSRRQDDIKDQAQDYALSKAAGGSNLINSTSSQDSEKQRRIAEREARRSRRRRNREMRCVVDHNEGMSTDDEENNSELTRFNVEHDRIVHDAGTIFEDVVDDFHQLVYIKGRFEEWKEKHNNSYTEAYIGLCLPKLYTPLIKLQLIDWNPIKEDCDNFEETSWFESLMFYGFRDSEDISLDDPDIKLMPSLIEKVLLPKLTGVVEHIYDPLSTRETARLVRLISKLISDYPMVSADNKNTQALIKAVIARIRKTLDDDVFMPLYPKQVLETKSGQYTFYQRQFWTCVKLLGNILLWHGILSDTTLGELALDSLLNRYIMLALTTSPITNETIRKCQAIINTFPKAWFANLETESTLPKLENLCRLLVYIGQNSGTTPDGKPVNLRDQKERLKQIAKLLMNIHAHDHYSRLAAQMGGQAS